MGHLEGWSVQVDVKANTVSSSGTAEDRALADIPEVMVWVADDAEMSSMGVLTCADGLPEV